MTEPVKERKKIGRPSNYTPELGARILEMHADGHGIKAICDQNDWAPARAATVLEWAETYPAFGASLARARKMYADALAAQTLDVLTNERDPQRARVAIQARQWLAGKMDRARFGDSVQVELDHKLNLADALSAAHGRLGPIRDQPNVIEGEVIEDATLIEHTSHDYKSSDEDFPDFFD